MDVVWLRSYGGLILIFCLFCNSVANASLNVTSIRFNEGYSPLFGDGNLVRSPDGKSVRLLLDRFTGILILQSLSVYMIRFLESMLFEFRCWIDFLFFVSIEFFRLRIHLVEDV